MNQRGRKSLSDNITTIAPDSRPLPPKDLTPEQKQIWRQTVGNMPADWFRPPIFPLLIAYCCSSARISMIESVIAELDIEGRDWKQYNLLSLMSYRETRLVTTLATRLRIVQKRNPRPNAEAGNVVAMPWPTAKD